MKTALSLCFPLLLLADAATAAELRASWPVVEAEGVREYPLPNETGPLWPG